jgi:hypothetical protein
MKNERIIRGYNITPFSFSKFKSMGVTPYYYESSDLSTFVEITNDNWQKINNKRVFLLSSDEFDRISKIVETTNKIIEGYREKIELMKEMVPSILVEKIME